MRPVFQGKYEKTVIAYIGRVDGAQGRRMGHAGAIVSTAGESAAEKVAFLKECGIVSFRPPQNLLRAS